jgi:hypothetical protein
MKPDTTLLGRLPTTPDRRDFTIEMVRTASALELAYLRLMAARGANPAVKNFATELMATLAPAPAPEPPPPPADQDVIWQLPDPVLDQGASGHCGGFGGCQWGNLAPVDDHFRNSDGHALYYESVSIGGFPGTEDGVESRWVAQALQARGRLDTYGFASTVDEVRSWVRSFGPVMMGTDWTEDMFTPDEHGIITPTGAWAGGHFWVICGDLVEEGLALCLNSWSDTWGQAGYFRMSWEHIAALLIGMRYPGDAIVSPELAI